MTHRVALFVDYQNAYEGARETFFSPGAFHSAGNFDPGALAARIAARDVTRTKREVAHVRVYTGRPSSVKEPKTYAAHMRQCAAWDKAGATVVHRTLNYRGWPRSRPRQKGVDVQMAIDFVMMKMRDEYDVGVMFSTDTDLLPALEAVCEMVGADQLLLPEVAAWGEHGMRRPRLRVSGTEVRCHWLARTDYDAVADTTDYNLKRST